MTRTAIGTVCSEEQAAELNRELSRREQPRYLLVQPSHKGRKSGAPIRYVFLYLYGGRVAGIS